MEFHAHDHCAVDGGVELAVSVAVEPVTARGHSGAGGIGLMPASLANAACLGVDALGVVSCDDH